MSTNNLSYVCHKNQGKEKTATKTEGIIYVYQENKDIDKTSKQTSKTSGIICVSEKPGHQAPGTL